MPKIADFFIFENTAINIGVSNCSKFMTAPRFSTENNALFAIESHEFSGKMRIFKAKCGSLSFVSRDKGN